MTNVVHLSTVKPKTLQRQHRNCKYTVTFVKATPELASHWKWDVEYINVTHYTGTAKSTALAIRAAEKHIDRTMELKGK